MQVPELSARLLALWSRFARFWPYRKVPAKVVDRQALFNYLARKEMERRGRQR
jgi:hypothetical protein